MFRIKKLNNKINRLHERCLRLIYSDRISSYEELLDKDNSVPIYQNLQNLQKLATLSEKKVGKKRRIFLPVTNFFADYFFTNDYFY